MMNLRRSREGGGGADRGEEGDSRELHCRIVCDGVCELTVVKDCELTVVVDEETRS
jgi:hypothetical protein